MEDYKLLERKNKGFVYFIIVVILCFIVFEGLAATGVIATGLPYKTGNSHFWKGDLIDNVTVGNYTGSLYIEDKGVWYLVTSNGEVPMGGGEGSPLPKYERVYIASVG